MRSKSNKIQFIALAFVMLFSVMNVWGIEVIHKGIIARHSTFEKSYPNDDHSSFNNSYGTYTWTSDNSYRVALKSSVLTWGNTIDLSEYDYVIVGTSVTSGTAQIIIDYKDANNRDQLVKYPITPGVCKINLEGIWKDYYDVNVDIRQTNLLKKVTGIRFGGTSPEGKMYFKEISFAKKGRTVDWDVNGHIVLGYEDILGDIWWTSRDGDYIEKTNTVRADNYGHYATFISSFDQCLDVRTVTFNGKVYNGANNLIENFITRNLYDNDDVTRKDNRTYHGKDKLNEEISMSNNSTLSDVEFMLSGTGSMHLYNIVIKHKDVKTITFDSDGGSFCAPIDYYRTAITLPTPTKDSYVFDGWYNGKTKVTNPSSYKPNGDVTLKARWKAGIPKFDVTQNRIYHLDFEGMSDNDLLSGDGAPTGVPTSDQQGKYYNYGGKGRILKDSNVKFGNYYQNLAVGTDEFTNSHAENFLRIVFTDAQKQKFNNIVFHSKSNGDPDYSHPKPVSERAATIGFWVNAKLANKYELPLERGSMFCMFSNERFQKADDDLQPRYMFDIACNGWAYSYMPNSYYVTKKDKNGNDIIDSEGNPQQELVEYMNKFYYGEKVDVVTTRTPKESLFGSNNYAHTQDQRQHKFYDDNNWHYVTYVATNDLKYVTMYLDGEKVGEQDMSMLEGEDNCQFDENGDYGARVFYLRNLVLGGFTPHGLFFNGPKKGGQYYSDAALAYDDISIYSVALSQNQIKDIIATKNYVDAPTEWHFRDALKSYGVTNNFNIGEDKWVSKGNGVYELKTQLGTSSNKAGASVTQPLTINGEIDGESTPVLFSTEGLKFCGAPGTILVDTKNGLIGLKKGAKIFVPGIPAYASVYFVLKSGDPNEYIYQWDMSPEREGLFSTAGVSLYGGYDDDDFKVIVARRGLSAGDEIFDVFDGTKTTKEHMNSTNILWLSDVILSDYHFVYERMLNEGQVREKNTSGPIEIVPSQITLSGGFTELFPVLENGSPSHGSIDKLTGCPAPTVRYSSSAPHIAKVASNGSVTLTGLAGSAIIKAELIFDNIHDGCISTAYEVRVKDRENTNYIAAGVESLPVGSSLNKGDVVTGKDKNGNDMYEYKVNESSDILVSLGGWPYKDNSYDGKDGSVTDSWVKPSGNGYLTENDMRPIDNYEAYVVGSQNAASESLGLNENFNNAVSDGKFIDKSRIDGVNQELDKPMSVKLNETAWRLPCRGTYVKVQPQKAGVVSMYIHQNGNLGDETGTGNDKHCTSVSWRPVYVADETGRVLMDDELLVTSNSRISQNDNFFRQGRRRGQFIGELADITINETFSVYDKLRESLAGMKRDYSKRYETLMANWANAGWKQRIIQSGDGGHMIMSKGMMRYTFNVYPGKTYYIFSNDTKIGISGYNFKADKHLKKGSSNDYSLEDVVKTRNTVVFEDVSDGTKVSGKTYSQPAFPDKTVSASVKYNRGFTANKWSSICLPFSMNNKQMVDIFGEGTKVVLLKQIYPEGNSAQKNAGSIEFVYHVNQDIIAGYPYLILPTKDVSSINVNAHFEGIEQPLFSIGSTGATLKHGTTEILNVSTGDYANVKGRSNVAAYHTDYPYVFEGCFTSTELPKYSYAMSTSGSLTRLTTDVVANRTVKPFRAYLKCVDPTNPSKLTNMSFDEVEEGEITTSIDNILQQSGVILNSSDVYGIDGKVVRRDTHSLQGLSKGVYVVNGKKYVVK